LLSIYYILPNSPKPKWLISGFALGLLTVVVLGSIFDGETEAAANQEM
jgi:hypothetical protein